MTAENSNACVTFDLWETLILDEPERDETRGRLRYEGLQHVLGDQGIQLPVEALKKAYEESARRFQKVWRSNDEVTIPEQIRLIIELATGQPMITNPEWAEAHERAYVEPIFRVPPKLNEDAPALLQELRNRGYKIGLISNTGRSPGEALRRLLQTYGILKFFNATVFSNEVLRRKPDKTIFEHAARLLGAESRDMVHVGDDPGADIWGAKQAGMRAILLEQSTSDPSRWRPDSLFALARAIMPRSPEIEPDRRVISLREVVGAVDALLPRTQ
jgi:putative hydrolase of the HAD superfamily